MVTLFVLSFYIYITFIDLAFVGFVCLFFEKQVWPEMIGKAAGGGKAHS